VVEREEAQMPKHLQMDTGAESLCKKYHVSVRKGQLFSSTDGRAGKEGTQFNSIVD
jgi:hypothetical protein